MRKVKVSADVRPSVDANPLVTPDKNSPRDETPEPSISDQPRDAITFDGRSCFELGYHTCRPQLEPLISRFVRGKRTLTLRSADSLARALGLILVKAGGDTTLG